MAAIGTDTGGSIRVPAALCGLAGYRASLGRGDWQEAAHHLAPSFEHLRLALPPSRRRSFSSAQSSTLAQTRALRLN